MALRVCYAMSRTSLRACYGMPGIVYAYAILTHTALPVFKPPKSDTAIDCGRRERGASGASSVCMDAHVGNAPGSVPPMRCPVLPYRIILCNVQYCPTVYYPMRCAMPGTAL
eukprot:1189261-Rhodomonas_salina.2